VGHVEHEAGDLTCVAMSPCMHAPAHQDSP
jgi:hypothetical protein